MRHEIQKTEYDAIVAGDLAERFESFIAQQRYLEVLECNGLGPDTLIGKLEELPDGYYNASCYFAPVDMPVSDRHPNGYTYVSTIEREAHGIPTTYWRYDTLEDAIAHNTELMLSHITLGV